MDEFTEQERQTVNSIIAREYEGLTADEVRLIIRWEVSKALMEDRYLRQIKLDEAESLARIEASNAIKEQAIGNLIELRNKAMKLAGV